MREILGLNQPEPLSYEDPIAALFRQFPELKHALERKLPSWGAEMPEARIVFGELFAPYVSAVAGSSYAMRMMRVARFLEWLADAPDASVRMLVRVSVNVETSGGRGGRPMRRSGPQRWRA